MQVWRRRRWNSLRITTLHCQKAHVIGFQMYNLSINTKNGFGETTKGLGKWTASAFPRPDYSICFFAFKEKNRSYDFKCGIYMLMYEGVFKWDEFLRIFFFQLAVALRKDYFPLIEFLLMLGSVRRGKSLNTKENIAKFFTVFWFLIFLSIPCTHCDNTSLCFLHSLSLCFFTRVATVICYYCLWRAAGWKYITPLEISVTLINYLYLKCIHDIATVTIYEQ